MEEEPNKEERCSGDGLCDLLKLSNLFMDVLELSIAPAYRKLPSSSTSRRLMLVLFCLFLSVSSKSFFFESSTLIDSCCLISPAVSSTAFPLPPQLHCRLTESRISDWLIHELVAVHVIGLSHCSAPTQGAPLSKKICPF